MGFKRALKAILRFYILFSSIFPEKILPKSTPVTTINYGNKLKKWAIIEILVTPAGIFLGLTFI